MVTSAKVVETSVSILGPPTTIWPTFIQMITLQDQMTHPSKQRFPSEEISVMLTWITNFAVLESSTMSSLLSNVTTTKKSPSQAVHSTRVYPDLFSIKRVGVFLLRSNPLFMECWSLLVTSHNLLNFPHSFLKPLYTSTDVKKHTGASKGWLKCYPWPLHLSSSLKPIQPKSISQQKYSVCTWGETTLFKVRTNSRHTVQLRRPDTGHLIIANSTYCFY